MKSCVSCGEDGHTYLECKKIPFFGLVAGTFGLPAKSFCELDEQQIIKNIQEINQEQKIL